jgi:hypothetical protein
VGSHGDEVLLAAGRNAVDDDVLDAREGGVGLFGRGDGLLRRLDAVAQLLGLRDERGLVLLGRRGDGLAVRVLRGAQPSKAVIAARRRGRPRSRRRRCRATRRAPAASA